MHKKNTIYTLNIIKYLFINIIIITNIACDSRNSYFEINNAYLIKNKIIDGTSASEDGKFLKISDICISDEGNLYIADSNKKMIFIFDKNQKYIKSFGRGGQGPGEFTGEISISAGQDKNIYAYDNGNRRIYKYSKRGEYIDQIKVFHNLGNEVPIVNNRSEIYLYSQNGYNIIDVYNEKQKYIRSLIDLDIQISNNNELPKYYKYNLKNKPDPNSIKKILLRNGDILLVINSSLIFVKIGNNENIVTYKNIYNRDYDEDYKFRNKNLIDKKTWINSFGSIFEDNNNMINLCYFHARLKEPVIYRFNMDGKYIDRIRIANDTEKTNRAINICDDNGNYYGISADRNKIIIYSMKKSL
jgi:hypothetical protein